MRFDSSTPSTMLKTGALGTGKAPHLRLIKEGSPAQYSIIFE
jgi:hypothetical protein